MSKLFIGPTGTSATFMCPACGYGHTVNVNQPGSWGWNGSIELPTLTPSILLRTGSAVDPNFVDEPSDRPKICHSFVVDGKIQYLSDCDHAFAGQTVDLPEWVQK